MKKEINISLEQAKIMYTHEALRNLALQLYSKDELELPTYMEVEKRVENDALYLLKNLYNSNLAMIARYLNGDWHKNSKNEGYFIANSNYLENVNIEIGKHITVCYPGLTYFKSPETLEKAVRWLRMYKLDFK